MKTGIVLIPFVDGKTGIAYRQDDEFKASSKRFNELVKAELISAEKEVETTEEDSEEETEEKVENETLEETEENTEANNETTEEDSEEETEEKVVE